MRSGIVLGEAARIDGLLDMVIAELSCANSNASHSTIILTGDNAAAMAAILRHGVTVDDTLTLRGLAVLYRINSRK